MSIDNERTEILKVQAAELIDILMSMFDSDDVDASQMATIAQGLERYVRQVEQMATTAEAIEWMGLYNICVLYQTALVPIASNPEVIDEQTIMLLETWPSLLIHYLEAPGSPETSSALIEHLQQPAWIAPLPEDEAEILKVMLADIVPETPTSESVDVSIEIETPIDASVDVPIATGDTPRIDETLIEDPTPPADTFAESDTFSDDHAPEADVGFEPSTIETELAEAAFISDDSHLVSEFLEQLAPDDAPREPESPAIPSAAEETSASQGADEPELDATARELISLLSFEVSQFAESLEVLLLEETHEDWRQLLTDHLEEIERLGDGAEAAGLAGLKQACGYIATNVLNVAAQDESLADGQRQIIAGWPYVALAYLENPYHGRTRTDLVSYLQDERWLQPLPDDSATP